MYLMLKIKIFKMQLLKNYTANPINSTCSYSMVSPCFREHCPIRGVFSKNINVKIFFTLIGRRDCQFRVYEFAEIVLPQLFLGSSTHLCSLYYCDNLLKLYCCLLYLFIVIKSSIIYKYS